MDGQVRTKHLALKTASAEFRVGNDHGLKSLFGNFRGFLKDLLRACFETNIAPLAPFLVEVDGYRLFLFVGGFFQGAALPSCPVPSKSLLPCRSRETGWVS